MRASKPKQGMETHREMTPKSDSWYRNGTCPWKWAGKLGSFKR